MFLGKLYRKKRKVSLRSLSAPPKTGHTMSHWLPPLQNVPQRERCWFDSIFLSHRSFCGCDDPIRHLGSLAARYNMQPGPSPGGDRRPQRQAPVRTLPALPAPESRGNPPRPCRGGDGAEGGDGPAGDGGPTAAEEDYRAEDLEELYAALEGDE